MSDSKTTFGLWWDISMLILILYVLVELAIEVITKFSIQTLSILSTIDLVICMIFLFDWFYFFIKSESKKTYIKTRFLDLISSLPLAQLLRPLRILRFVRLTRSFKLIRGLRGVSPFFRLLLKNPQRSALTIYSFITILVYSYCTLGLFNYEYGVNEAIKGIEDIVWMSFTTLTTVGYGDYYPITTGGRIMAAILVITGMGLFGLLISEIATTLMSKIEIFKEQDIQE